MIWDDGYDFQTQYDMMGMSMSLMRGYELCTVQYPFLFSFLRL